MEPPPCTDASTQSKIKVGDGMLHMACGSHKLGGYERSDNKLVGTAIRAHCFTLRFAQLPGDWKKARATAKWHASGVEPGDVIIFNVKTVHAATANETDCFRLR